MGSNLRPVVVLQRSASWLKLDTYDTILLPMGARSNCSFYALDGEMRLRAVDGSSSVKHCLTSGHIDIGCGGEYDTAIFPEVSPGRGTQQKRQRRSPTFPHIGRLFALTGQC